MTEKWKTLSYSQMGSFTTCAKKYEYEYVDRLKLKKGAVQQSSLGDLVHHGIAGALRKFSEKQVNNKPHKIAHLYAASEAAIREQANKSRHDVLMLEGDELPVDDGWNQLATDAYLITVNVIDELQLGKRYAVAAIPVRDPNTDKLDYIPLIEFYISADLTDNARFSGVVDAVLYDIERDDYILFDWKVRGRFTGYDVEVLNGQLPLYQRVLNEVYGFNISTSVLFQIKDKAPQKPEMLKNGKQMSRRAIVSTWDLYKSELIAQGLDPADYIEEMAPKLAATEFFSPIEITRTGETLQRFWDNAEKFAINIGKQSEYPMALGYPCRTCNFQRLCAAKMMGYGIEEAMDAYETRHDDISFEED